MSKVSVPELLDLIPEELLESLSHSTQVNKWVKKLKGSMIFKLLLFSVLQSERVSLRDIEANSKLPIIAGLSPDLLEHTVRWTGVRDRLIHINVEYFSEIYAAMLAKATSLYNDQELSGYHIKRYDSTMIHVFGHLLSGMKVGNTSKNKYQVKLTTEQVDSFQIRINFHQEQSYLSEETALKEIILESSHDSKDIVVFDNGLKSRAVFRELDESKIQFVTNIGSRPRYEIIAPHSPIDIDNNDLEFLQDSRVLLFESGKNKPNQHEFRLIEYKVRKSGKHLFILSNLWDSPASIIALCYQRRWDIEVLFRFLKQEMNLTHFISNDLNAIKAMIYIKLIATVLVLIYKKKNKIKTYKRAKSQFFNELCAVITLDLVENPTNREWFIQATRNFIQKE